ncbi:helix-turn-helix domain-containing protein [Micromonospora sp. NPDC048935]|uniref:helix-turn-helix domain-containing protein n=1 Tax=Micromonospora sp. NPDC048935 TaxID=3364262 RepID=UPI003712E338
MANEQSTAGGAPDPQAARSAAEFVAQMRALRQWSGLTIRQVTRKAQEAGDVLPHSTLNTALGRATLPREELVAAFVRACGGDQDTVNAWITVRKGLAAAAAGQPEPVATVATVAGTAGASSIADEPRVRPPWGLLDAVPPLPAELSQVTDWERDGVRPPETTGDEPDSSETVTPGSAVAGLASDEPAAAVEKPHRYAPEPNSSAPREAAASPRVPEPAATRPDLAAALPEPTATRSEPAATRSEPAAALPEPTATRSEPAATRSEPAATRSEPAATRSEPTRALPEPADAWSEPAGVLSEAGAGESVPAADRPSRVHAYSDGPLATAVRNRRDGAWSGLHRKRAAEADGAAVAPLRLRDFVPPLAFRAGWSTRVLLGAMVVLLVLVAVGVAVRALRDANRGDGPTGVQAGPTVAQDDGGQLLSKDRDGKTASPSPPAIIVVPAPTTRAPRSPRASPTRAVAAALPAAGKYRMMPAATVGGSNCVGVGPEPGNDRPEVAVIVPCAEAEPAASELRKVAADTYQIYWARPSGGGGCLQVDPDPNGEPSTAHGQLLAPRGYCDRPDQRFVLEPVQTNAGQGYRLHAATAPKMCIGPVDGGRTAGTAVAQVSCFNDNVQVFLFKP